MFGLSNKSKNQEILDVKRGDIFTINNGQIVKDINSKRSVFSNESIDTIWFNTNKVIIISNDVANRHSSSLHVLPITKSLVGDITSIDDMRTIKRTYLEEKVNEVSQSTLKNFESCFMHENHKGILIEYQYTSKV